ncbi:MAG: TRAP transporter large permease subunit, partial [Hyphomicrobiaceae bacterium]|nr:TRAP transporter large permease subunit [Hyphomicrobiaceae bacterium]
MSKSTVSTKNNMDNFVAEAQSSARHPRGWQAKLVFSIALTWSLYQLYLATSMPFYLVEITGLNIFTDLVIYARRIHLMFALILAAMIYPLFRSTSLSLIPVYDFIIIGLSVLACLYTIILNEQLTSRAGAFTINDTIVGVIGLSVLFIAVMRSLGLPLIIVASIFMLYVFLGSSSWVPEIIRWKGASLGKTVWHYWIQDEGVFGKPLDVSTTMIFLFVLFGSILEKSGAGNYFIQLAFSLLGHLRGGPAKAAVIASALSGIYSGSSIANTVTTGTFTIPLMKKTG